MDNTNIDCKSTGFNDITISHQFEVDKILVVDNIENSSEFSSSTRILKEVKLFCPDIKIEFAYSLSKGGIAIHATCREDRDRLLNELPAESFGGGFKHPPKGQGSTNQDSNVLFLKGLDTSVDLHDLQGYLHKKELLFKKLDV